MTDNEDKFLSTMALLILDVFKEAEFDEAYIAEKRERLRGVSYCDCYIWSLSYLDFDNQKRLARRFGVSWEDWYQARETMIQIHG